MKSKLKFILPLALLILGGAGYQLVLAKEAPKHEPKIHGDVYVMPKDFLVNLEDGHFAKLGVALVVDHGSALPPDTGGHGAAPKPAEGYGTMPQEPAVRAIVTDTLTDVAPDDLTAAGGRKRLQERIEKRIKKLTDVAVHDVLFTDVSVQ
jgi:flagellar FliL protein